MIKKILYFGNPCYLSSKDEQMKINYNKEDNNSKTDSIPIEDIGIIIIDHYGVTISQFLISKLNENNVSVVFCNERHMPTSMLLNLDGNSVQTERFNAQVSVKKPVIKNLWQQTVSAKIFNQASLLKKYNKNSSNMFIWAKCVKSNDSSNLEARAATYYWKNIFPDKLEFSRDRYGLPPNNLLNYGYAILRAAMARGLISSGLLPTMGIHHKNKYNSYCLADDIMEPYRPFVDELVLNIVKQNFNYIEITNEIKKKLLSVTLTDVYFNNKKSPLMIGIQKTTSSLVRCYMGESKKIIYPEFH